MKTLFILTLLSIGFISCNAQIFDMLNSDLYHARVKLISEFMQRFNGEEIHPYIAPDAADITKINLCQLFDADRITQNRQANEAKAFEFVDSVLTNNVKIRYSDPDWYAKVKAIGQFRGKEVSFYLYLTVEPRGNDMYKWVIADVEGALFQLRPSSESEKIMLLPNEHELDFMHLYSITSEKEDYITLYSSDCSPVNRLTVFNTLVYYGNLDIEYVTDIEFTFLQVPGYSFTVKEFERESTNSGWLISEWKEITPEDKMEILQRLYNGLYMDRPDKNTQTDKQQKPDKIPTGEAIQKVEAFVRDLNEWINGKSDSTDIDRAVKGRFHFTIADELCDRLSEHYKTKKQVSYSMDTLLAWLRHSDTPVKTIAISNPELFENENIRPDYTSRFTLIKCDLSTTGDIQLTEKVVFFIYGNQIAGVKSISYCF